MYPEMTSHYSENGVPKRVLERAHSCIQSALLVASKVTSRDVAQNVGTQKTHAHDGSRVLRHVVRQGTVKPNDDERTTIDDGFGR